MSSSLLICRWLVPLVALVTLSTGELEFYQDSVPQASENIALKPLARYFETQNQEQRSIHRAHLPAFLLPQIYKKHYMKYGSQKEKESMQAMSKKSDGNNMMGKKSSDSWSQKEQIPYSDLIKKVPSRRSYAFSYFDVLNPVYINSEKYPSGGLSYPIDKIESEDMKFAKTDPNGNPDTDLLRHLPHVKMSIVRGMKEEPISEFHDKYTTSNDGINHEESKELMPSIPVSKFTFKIDNFDLNDQHTFVVKPNDPRYHQETTLSPGEEKIYNHHKTPNSNADWRSKVRHILKSTGNINQDHVIYSKFADTKERLDEVERHTGYRPVFLTADDLETNIYFIAVVAGCSAAAMFVLVLISLTWCRIKGVKPVDDIHYPAYGVTGPNKDISPSGDQRLAQSAQMYHFQHQKQQIIAMERDPGSISEAESDEENEEGDYTVYECPGLASTGEMEVKNPLFHDDPTPATPAQTDKKEDHV